MVAPAASFSDFVLAIHIFGVIVAFGVTFAYPVFLAAGARQDPRAMPWFHRMQVVVSRRVTNPGLLVVLIAGIVLASDLHQWKHFYVGWGIVAVIVLGALEGAVVSRTTQRLAELAEADVQAAATGKVAWSEEYQAQMKRLRGASGLMSLIVALTVLFMAIHL
jgi:ABC-type amino acid transport system permease subunit